MRDIAFQSVLLILFTSFLIGCSTVVTKPNCDLTMYSKNNYSAIATDKVSIIYSRLKIPQKYFEIGVIKKGLECSEESIIKMASTLGANLIVKEKSNYILIRFLKQEEGESDEGIKT